jgi:hypothetical protein
MAPLLQGRLAMRARSVGAAGQCHQCSAQPAGRAAGAVHGLDELMKASRSAQPSNLTRTPIATLMTLRDAPPSE